MDDIQNQWTFRSDVDRRMLDEYYLDRSFEPDDHVELEDAYGFIEWSIDWDVRDWGVKGFTLHIQQVDVTAEYSVTPPEDSGREESTLTERVVYPEPRREVPTGADAKTTVLALAPKQWTAEVYPTTYQKIAIPFQPSGVTIDWPARRIVVGFS